jgi:peptide deformylase
MRLMLDLGPLHNYLEPMAVLTVLTAPDPRLKIVAAPVEAVDDDLRAFMDDMVHTMYAAKGIGLAATQVGVNKRVVVMDLAHDGEPPQVRHYVNPELIWVSDEKEVFNEGCLSVPDQYDDVERPARVKARFLDYHGNQQEIEADGLLADCLQHEIDHLNGVLFIDHLSRLKRSMILKRLEKIRRFANTG